MCGRICSGGGSGPAGSVADDPLRGIAIYRRTTDVAAVAIVALSYPRQVDSP